MNKDISFSPITKEAASELAQLDKECFSLPWSQKQFYEDAQNPLAYYALARIDGELAGYCGIYSVADEGQITNIAVAKKFRRMGVAKAILDKITEYAVLNGLSVITLEVRESNEAAINLYLKKGFERVGYRKGYYHDPDEGAVLMDLNLKGRQ